MAGSMFERLYEFGQSHATVVMVAGGALALLAGSYAVGDRKAQKPSPPLLSETVPFVTNTVQMVSDIRRLCARARQAMESASSNILRVRLMGRSAYLIMGEKNTQGMFQINSGLTTGEYMNKITQVMFGCPSQDFERFANDTSGRSAKPLPGYEHVPDKDRMWHGWHSIIAQNLTQTKPSADLAARFFDNLYERVSTEVCPSTDEWYDMRVCAFMEKHQFEAAAFALSGTGIFDKNPNYREIFLGYEKNVLPAVFGPPRFLNRAAYRAVDRFHEMCHEYALPVIETFDWDGPEGSAEWEPKLGALFSRRLIRWALDSGLEPITAAHMWGIQIVNQNSNTLAASEWAIMDSVRRPEVWRQLRREAEAAMSVCPDTGKRRFDASRLTQSPWLQAVYVEELRLRAAFFITRNVDRDGVEIDGFPVPKDAMVQAPSLIAHYHSVWASDGHPVAEFWPERHLQPINGEERGTEGGVAVEGPEMKFSLGSRSGYWFPYGGGPTMCPGRHFAKQEIIMTIALFAAMFEVEDQGWAMMDGSPSDRAPGHGDAFVVIQPDRDMKLRVKRRW